MGAPHPCPGCTLPPQEGASFRGSPASVPTAPGDPEQTAPQTPGESWGPPRRPGRPQPGRGRGGARQEPEARVLPAGTSQHGRAGGREGRRAVSDGASEAGQLMRFAPQLSWPWRLPGPGPRCCPLRPPPGSARAGQRSGGGGGAAGARSPGPGPAPTGPGRRADRTAGTGVWGSNVLALRAAVRGWALSWPCPPTARPRSPACRRASRAQRLSADL